VLPSLNFPQLDFVKPSSGLHPVTWEHVNGHRILIDVITHVETSTSPFQMAVRDVRTMLPHVVHF